MGKSRRFQLQEVVGRGGFGTVYRAHQLGNEDVQGPIALKILNPDVADQDFVAERLRDEARMLALLRHRAIVRFNGMYRLDGRWAVAMEFVEGATLKQLQHAGPVPIGCALAIIEQAASAFHYAYKMPAAHGRPLRLLHRDIKPANIHLTSAGEVKILDFGVAWGDFQERESVTESLMFGSLDYMSPERLDSIDTHAGDIYALGAVLFELLVGEPLGRASGNKERHNAMLETQLGLLWERCQDEDVYRLVADCLAYDEATRPAAQMLERRTRALRTRYSDPWLGAWAAEVVPPLRAMHTFPNDDLTGSILTESGEKIRMSSVGRLERQSWLWMLLGGGVTLLAVAIVAMAGAGLWWWMQAPLTTPAVDPSYVPELLPSNSSSEDILRHQAIEEPRPSGMPSPPAASDLRSEEPSPTEAPPRPIPADGPVQPSGEGTPSSDGSVLVQGDVRALQLSGTNGTYGPGAVPAGEYAVSVSFDGQQFHSSGVIDVQPDQQVHLICRETMQRCVAR